MRFFAIDIARGIAIIAIVLGHVLRGLASSGIVDETSAAFLATDRALYMGHLTVFAFLAGLFVGQGVEKRGDKAYLYTRLSNFLYLYILWQTIQVVVKLVTGSLVNSAPEASALWEFWKPEGQLWFMPWLVIVTLVAVVAKPWQPGTLARTVVVASILISLATWAFEGPVVGTQGISLLSAFIIGARIRFDRIKSVLSKATAKGLLLTFTAASTGYAALLVLTPALPPTVNAPWAPLGVLLGAVASSVALVAVITLSTLLSRSNSFEWLKFVGQRSLEIFLAHVIFASGTRIALSMIGVDSQAIHLVAGVAAGTVLPMLLCLITARLRMDWVFELPSRKHELVSK